MTMTLSQLESALAALRSQGAKNDTPVYLQPEKLNLSEGGITYETDDGGFVLIRGE